MCQDSNENPVGPQFQGRLYRRKAQARSGSRLLCEKVGILVAPWALAFEASLLSTRPRILEIAIASGAEGFSCSDAPPHLAPSSYLPTGPRQRGGDAAEIGDLLVPVGGIPTVAGLDVTLVVPPALMARTT